jgi:hypothetical protein
MRKRLLVVLATTGLALGGLIGFDADPASAHIFDTRAEVSCVVTSPFGGTWVLDHAHPIWFNEHVVQEGCVGHQGGVCRRWEALYWRGDIITGPYNVTAC